VARRGLVSTIVLEGVSSTTLLRGAGHIPETALPGDRGNVGIAAHRDSFFRALKDIRKNDTIRLETLDGTFSYRVDWTRIVTPEETAVLDDTDSPALTLVTCYPFSYVGSAPNRFIVRAMREL
jgi:sortase A